MKHFDRLRFFAPLLGVVLFLCFPAEAASGVRDGLRQVGTRLIPALFPIQVSAACLVRMEPTANADRFKPQGSFRLPGLPGRFALPILLGLLGGYPLGAQLTATFCRKRVLTRMEAIRLSAVCNNAGPAFLIGVLGGILRDPVLGAALFLIHFISLLLVGFLLRPMPEPSPSRAARGQRPNKCGFFQILPEAIGDCALSMLRLAGSVVFFRSVWACVEAVLPISFLPPVLRAGLSGFLELAGGSELLRELPTSSAFPLAAFLSGWGGLCVHLQAALFFRSEGLPMQRYLLGKLLHGILSGTLALFLSAPQCGQAPFRRLLPILFVILGIFFAFFAKRRWKKTNSVL